MDSELLCLTVLECGSKRELEIKQVTVAALLSSSRHVTVYSQFTAHSTTRVICGIDCEFYLIFKECPV